MAKPPITDVRAAIEHLGGYSRVRDIVGLGSHNAIKRWARFNRLPRTDLTGDTRYAELMARADPEGRIDPVALKWCGYDNARPAA